jgi:CDGSH-type Zn-finger protein
LTEFTIVEHADFVSSNVSNSGIQSSLIDGIGQGDEGTPVCARCERSGRWCDKTLPLKIRLQKNVSGQRDSTDTTTNSNILMTEGGEEPRATLQDEQAAELFEHYLRVLASWYDLNDLDCAFARIVGQEAQHSDLLLNAVLAFSAIHKCRTGQSSLKELADGHHTRCLHLLIGLRQSDKAVSDGTALAATCLLRSYEILAGELMSRLGDLH